MSPTSWLVNAPKNKCDFCSAMETSEHYYGCCGIIRWPHEDVCNVAEEKLKAWKLANRGDK